MLANDGAEEVQGQQSDREKLKVDEQVSKDDGSDLTITIKPSGPGAGTGYDTGFIENQLAVAAEVPHDEGIDFSATQAF